MTGTTSGKLKKALLPFLIGIVLKAYTLVPLKLMVMTFMALMALLVSKISVAIASVLALHQYYQHSSVPSMHDLGSVGAFSAPFYAVTAAGQTGVANQVPLAPTGQDQQYSPSAPQPYIRRIHVKYT
ncbi:uncharacterized protein LOC106662396 [Cimex lectularius]|uniref:Uncharacterized protein n=1 Tax=Cimex lectularius TaxID=79782 RepID=A0A8I6RCA6_CIMLE|nr:uncharacterized protein LOC106662396 [Cimex lectularius]